MFSNPNLKVVPVVNYIQELLLLFEQILYVNLGNFYQEFERVSSAHSRPTSLL